MAAAAQEKPIEVFCSYAHKDEKLQQALKAHLSSLSYQGRLTLWHDRLLLPSMDWEHEIDAHLQSAKLILVLLSADFLASRYCYGIEMKRALERHQAHEALVVPILLRAVEWRDEPIARLQALPTNARPITSWENPDEAFADVAAGLRATLAQLPQLLARSPVNEQVPSLREKKQDRPWNVPYARNPFFAAREDDLSRLRTRLRQNNAAAIGQSAAISGLGGVGKTQLAVEYAYRHRADYRAVLWVNASSLETLNASSGELARLLALSERESSEQERIVQAVRRWLETQPGYLLILDNLDEPALLFPQDEHGQPYQTSPFLPLTPAGQVLITTRAADLSSLGLGVMRPLPLTPLTPEQGAQLLLTRAGLLDHAAPPEQAEQETRELALQITRALGGLALALDQAGAYLAATGESLAGYLALMQQHLPTLLRQHRGRGYPHSVAATWEISFTRVVERNPAAADLLRFCAFLAPDAIPEELLTEGAEQLGATLAPAVADPLAFNEAIEALRAYSLLSRDTQARTLSVHRLVQAVLRESLDGEEQQRWKQRAINAVEAAYPGSDFVHWSAYERLLPHALLCASWIEQDATLATPAAARLLNQTGFYLNARGRYAETEPLYQRALAIREQQLGPQHPDTATSLNNLALLYNSQGKYEQAEPLYARALAIREQQLGPQHPNTASSLNNLAGLYRSQGKYEQAELLYQRALAIREQQLGPAHPATATSLNNLAALYDNQGRYEQAEPLYVRALAICEQTLGKEHPRTQTVQNNLTALLRGREQK